MVHLILGTLLIICGLAQFGFLYMSSKPKPQPIIPESYIEDGWHGRLVLVKKTEFGYVEYYYKIDNYEHVKTEVRRFDDNGNLIPQRSLEEMMNGSHAPKKEGADE